MNFHNIYSVNCSLCIAFDQSNYFIREILKRFSYAFFKIYFQV